MMTLPAPNRAPHAPAPRPTRPAPNARPGTPPRARDHLRVLERPSVRGRRGMGVLGMVATFLLFVTLLALAAFQAIVVQSQQHIDGIDREVEEAQGRYERLRLEVAELESPARIVEAAVNRLGMVPPPGTTYLLPEPGAGLAARASSDDSASTLAAGAASSGAGWAEVKPYLGEGQ